MTFDDDEQIHSIQNGSAGFESGVIVGSTKVNIINVPYAEPGERRLKVLVELTGKARPIERPGLDLVVVLDISGNMRSRQDKQKEATEFVINKLSPVDRVSIVTFSKVAHKLCPLRQINKESQREILNLVNGSVTASADGANISAGLEMALQVLRGRKFVEAGRSVGIILMSSDGGAELELGDVPVYSLTMPHGKSDRGTLISDVAFTNCFSRLLTVVVQDLELVMSTGNTLIIENVYAGNYEQSRDDSTVSVMLGNLHDKETRRVLVHILPPVTCPLVGPQVLKVSYKYRKHGKELKSTPVQASKKQINNFTEEEIEDLMLEVDYLERAHLINDDNELSLSDGLVNQETLTPSSRDVVRDYVDTNQKAAEWFDENLTTQGTGTYQKQAESSNMDHVNSFSTDEDNLKQESVTPSEVESKGKDNVKEEEETITPSPAVVVKGSVNNTSLFSTSSVDTYQKHEEPPLVKSSDKNSLATNEENGKENLIAIISDMETPSLPQSSDQDHTSSSTPNEDNVMVENIANSSEVSHESKSLAIHYFLKALLLLFYLPRLIFSFTLPLMKTLMENSFLHNSLSSKKENVKEDIITLSSEELPSSAELSNKNHIDSLPTSEVEARVYSEGQPSPDRRDGDNVKKESTIPFSRVVVKGSLKKLFLTFYLPRLLFSLTYRVMKEASTPCKIVAMGVLKRFSVLKLSKKDHTNILASKAKNVTQENSSSLNEENVNGGFTAHSLSVFQKGQRLALTEIWKFRGRLADLSTTIVARTQKIWRSLQELGKTVRSMTSEFKTMKKAALLSIVLATIYYLLFVCFDNAIISEYLRRGNIHIDNEIISEDLRPGNLHFDNAIISEDLRPGNLHFDNAIVSEDLSLGNLYFDNAIISEDLRPDDLHFDNAIVSEDLHSGNLHFDNAIVSEDLSLSPGNLHFDNAIISEDLNAIVSEDLHSGNLHFDNAMVSEDLHPENLHFDNAIISEDLHPGNLHSDNAIISEDLRAGNLHFDNAISPGNLLTKIGFYIPSRLLETAIIATIAIVVLVGAYQVTVSFFKFAAKGYMVPLPKSSDKDDKSNLAPNEEDVKEEINILTSEDAPRVKKEGQPSAELDDNGHIYSLPRDVDNVSRKASEVVAVSGRHYIIHFREIKKFRGRLADVSTSVVARIQKMWRSLLKLGKTVRSMTSEFMTMKKAALLSIVVATILYMLFVWFGNAIIHEDLRLLTAIGFYSPSLLLCVAIIAIVVLLARIQRMWRSLQELGKTVRYTPSESKTMKKVALLSIAVATIYYMLFVCFRNAISEDLTLGKLLNAIGFYSPSRLLYIAIIFIVVLLVGVINTLTSEAAPRVEKDGQPSGKLFDIDHIDSFHKDEDNVKREAIADSSEVVAMSNTEILSSQELPDKDHTGPSSQSERNVKEEITAHSSIVSQKRLHFAPTEIEKFRGRLTGLSTYVVAITRRTWRSFQEHGNTVKSLLSRSKKMEKAALLSVGMATISYLLYGCFGNATFGDLSPRNLLTGFGFYNPFWLLDIVIIYTQVLLVGAYQVYHQPLFKFIDIYAASISPLHGYINKGYDIPLPGGLFKPFKLNFFRLVSRTIFVIITTTVLMLIPFFKDVVGIVGACGFWPLTVYFLVEMYVFQKKIPEMSKRWISLQILSVSCLIIANAAVSGSFKAVFNNLKVHRPFQTSY